MSREKFHEIRLCQDIYSPDNNEKLGEICIKIMVVSVLSGPEISLLYSVRSLGKAKCHVLTQDTSTPGTEYKPLRSEELEKETVALFQKRKKSEEQLKKLGTLLSNPSFVRNAPPDVVERNRNTKTQIEENLEVLDRLCYSSLEGTLTDIENKLTLVKNICDRYE